MSKEDEEKSIKITDDDIEEFTESVQGHIILDPNDVPEEDWRIVKTLAHRIMPTVENSVYKAAVLAYFEYLGYLENATRH